MRLSKAVILMRALTGSFVHAFACLLVCAFACSLSCVFAHLLVCAFVNSLTFAFADSLISLTFNRFLMSSFALLLYKQKRCGHCWSIMGH